MRVLQPRETPSGNGSAFATSDELLYLRSPRGTITRAVSKEQQRADRKADKKARKGGS